MKIKRLIFPLLLLGTMVALVSPAQGQTPGFIITGAEGQYTATVSQSQSLVDTFSNLAPRFVVTSAADLLYTAITKAPSGLLSSLELVPQRFVLTSAQKNQFFSVSYPTILIGDQEPPRITGNIPGFESGWVSFTMTTNEFTTAELNLGPASGNYTQSYTDSLFNKTHSFRVSGLTAGRIYFYQYRFLDRSGNQGLSSEYQVLVRNPYRLYLPFNRR
jgi:hypothetical protein